MLEFTGSGYVDGSRVQFLLRAAVARQDVAGLAPRAYFQEIKQTRVGGFDVQFNDRQLQRVLPPRWDPPRAEDISRVRLGEPWWRHDSRWSVGCYTYFVRALLACTLIVNLVTSTDLHHRGVILKSLGGGWGGKSRYNVRLALVRFNALNSPSHFLWGDMALWPPIAPSRPTVRVHRYLEVVSLWNRWVTLYCN